ncbi:MAG: glycosyltransferase family 2 protein [Candidatus Magasanikbacteria bacterium]
MKKEAENLDEYPKIAIVYLSFHCEPYIDDVVSALKNVTYPKDKLELVIVDNPHPDHGSSVRYLEENVMPMSGEELPHITLLPQEENLGFAGGNNKGAEWALENDYDYVFFHNDDGFVATNCFEPLVELMEQNEGVGMAQSLMLLHPDTDKINNTGNSFHYLGFGFGNNYRMPVKDYEKEEPQEIGYASGAALMVPTDLIEKHGAWDEDYFLYHEDMEWCFRLRSLGYEIKMVPNSIFYHKYQFSRSITKFYYMERNRYGTWLRFFSWPTLLMLLPMELVLEIGLLIYSIKNSWFDKRLKLYKYWLKPKNWKMWLEKRRETRKNKKVSDRELLAKANPIIEFQEKSMQDPLLKKVGNPIMKLYYYIVVRGLIWW